MTKNNLNQEELKKEVVEPEVLEPEVMADNQTEVSHDPAELKRLLDEKNAEAEANNNRALRLQADYENLRRRSRQEREDLIKYGSEHLIKELLPVLDNFERALASSGDGGDKFVSGVEMIHRQFIEVLTNEGLTPVPSVGEQFDPNHHEAVMQVEDTGSPENTVVEELRKGYFLKGKIIRPAMVKVARS
ncbi:nucleotide exchange factor GrpE [Desulforamulus aquiferis]|uniref:Protein GrpE n=1 Tax=Desulforamulus aquiferis TaxID=1397668 RepID=A0AAW7ZGU4_9FIRM|nr:nucleotide exchange factor GrpE [Desulforamulus aquiferis]MDO7788241.1 nucleotide exchange factor GrpE [Desulforamulus aquiferis]RYD03398.1 hypothetical protein N752_19665 [Desulforamulus aquiferis]